MFKHIPISPEQLQSYKQYIDYIKKDYYHDEESTSLARFSNRIYYSILENAFLDHQWWWFVHNCIAHPIIGLFPYKQTVEFHDFTSKKLNQHDPRFKRKSQSPVPVIKNSRLKWLEHNICAHLAIGLFPHPRTFWYHDKTAQEMNVPGWV